MISLCHLFLKRFLIANVKKWKHVRWSEQLHWYLELYSVNIMSEENIEVYYYCDGDIGEMQEMIANSDMFDILNA